MALEVEADSDEEALVKAVIRIKDRPMVVRLVSDVEDDHGLKEFFNDEFAESKMDWTEFLEQYLNYIYVDTGEGCYYVLHGEHLRIEKGWGLYDNSISVEEEI